MESESLLECALMVIFFANDIENCLRPQLFRDVVTSADLEIAFSEAEAYPIVDIDVGLDRTVIAWAGCNTSAILIEYLVPDETLRHLQGTIHSLTCHKRKYDELLDQTDREAQQRAQAKRASKLAEREERAKRRNELRSLENRLNEKTRELAAIQDSLRSERTDAKRLKRALECRICREGQWDTVTGCGHLFCAGCIERWLDMWVEDDEGYLVLREPQYPTCRAVVSAKDLRRVYV